MELADRGWVNIRQGFKAGGDSGATALSPQHVVDLVLADELVNADRGARFESHHRE